MTGSRNGAARSVRRQRGLFRWQRSSGGTIGFTLAPTPGLRALRRPGDDPAPKARGRRALALLSRRRARYRLVLATGLGRRRTCGVALCIRLDGAAGSQPIGTLGHRATQRRVQASNRAAALLTGQRGQRPRGLPTCCPRSPTWGVAESGVQVVSDGERRWAAITRRPTQPSETARLACARRRGRCGRSDVGAVAR